MEKQRSQYRAAVDALADPQRTRLVLVARAQGATLRESAAFAAMPEALESLPRDHIALKPFNLVGLDATGACQRDVVRQMGQKATHRDPRALGATRQERDERSM